ncbi:MAG: amino acid ABC transporter ATP-binding protein [Propionibacteriaceae bacterium]|jgi:cystine transport system ATP-binding protein|nr:amino acid ABC transporter ATP-binding protein [Propionibacteriaceae bacterium]
MSLLSVRGIHKTFGKNQVIRGIDLDIEPGTVTVIIGPSGCGKTTLLRSLNGLESPEKGVVSIDSVQVNYAEKPTAADVSLLRSKTGFVFQAHHLFPHRTVLQNVTEGLIYGPSLKRPASEANALGQSLLDQVGLGDKAKAYPSDLSGGQQQRVGIARALALQPKLLLFDEPTSALDPEIVGDVLQLMRKLAREGWTMAVVTHEIQFAKQVANNVVFVDQGVIVEQGTPQEVLANPRHPRTREFLRRVLDPLADDAEYAEEVAS